LDVIKKDGKKEPFNIGKIMISIQKAALDAGLPASLISAKARQISEKINAWSKTKTVIETSEIRSLVLSEMEKKDQEIAGSWRRFDTKFKI
jgi:transcriptional repressor NrdR